MILPEPEIPREGPPYRRPLIMPPGGDKLVPYTRATGMAELPDNRYSLERYFKRNVVLGIGLRPDLYARAVAADPELHKPLDEIAEQAEEAAKASAKANLGTALHQLCERVDRGETPTVIAPFAADVAAYVEATKALTHLAVERFVVLDSLKIGGTPDRISTAAGWRLPRIVDIKTGSLDYAIRAISIQLTIYAWAEHYYRHPGQRDALPELDREVAVVVHLPAGTGTCQLVEVDLKAGKEGLDLALAIRAWRNRKGLSWPCKPLERDEGPLAPEAEVEALRGLVRALDGTSKAALGSLVAEGEAAGVGWRPSARPTQWRMAVHRAAVAVAVTLEADPELTRAAVCLITGADPQPAFTLGALLGTLSTSEALRLAGLCVEIANGQRTVNVQLDGTATFPSLVA